MVVFGYLGIFGVLVCWYDGFLGVILGGFGSIRGFENGLKMGFRGGGRGVLRKWGFLGFSGV